MKILKLGFKKREKNSSLSEKIINSNLQAEKQKFEITKNEFEKLKQNSIYSLKRKSYLYSKNSEITIKVYEEDFEGLNRIEVEFESIEEAEKFEIPDWFGKEITNSNLGRDKKLVQLTKYEFNNLLEKIKE